MPPTSDRDRASSAEGERRESLRRFAAELGVVRNAKTSMTIGAGFAAALYVVFVVLPGPSTTEAVLYAMLAFVVAVAVALLLTILLTIRSARRRSKEL